MGGEGIPLPRAQNSTGSADFTWEDFRHHRDVRHVERREKALHTYSRERLPLVPSASGVVGVGLMAEEWLAGEWLAERTGVLGSDGFGLV